MPALCLYFQVHQPYRLKPYRIFDIGKDRNYFNGTNGNLNNKFVLRKVAEKSYLPTNRIILELLKQHPEFKVAFSLTGVILEQFKEFAPEVLKSFQDLVQTGRVELLGETYYHSLSFLYSMEEFAEQVDMHRRTIEKVFGVRPQVFRNTELIYRNDLAKAAEDMGFQGILAEGADHVLGWRSPDFLYRPRGTKKIGLLLKNYKLSDDIAFRFSSRSWEEWPLDTGKYGSWINAKQGNAQVVNLFMDYETFGEHQWEDTGIFDFLRALPGELLKSSNNCFITPSEALTLFKPVAELDVPHYVSWADVERDLSAWLSNPMQHDALRALYGLRERVLASKSYDILDAWRRMQTSDHFYYMCTKWFADGDVHKYFNPYDTPYDAYLSYMNVLKDLELQLTSGKEKKEKMLAAV